MKILRHPRALLPFSFFVLCSIVFSLISFPEGAAAQSATETKKANNVTFNFVDVDLPVIAKFISDITGKNFIFDEKVKGKITIIAPSKLPADEAYNLFTSVLELKGFTVVPSGVNAYKIIPAVEARQSGMRITTEGGPVNETYIARLLALKYISADEALKFFQPLVSRDGYISVFGPGNMLLVVDSGLNIEKISSLLDLIDRPSVTEIPEVITLKYASAETIARILTDGLGKGKVTRVIPGQPVSPEGATAVADERLNAVILFGDKGIRESMKALIALIDVPSPEAQGRINVYFLENADATELSKVLEGMIKGMQGRSQKQPGAPAGAGAAVTPFESAGGITITPDKATNALVIVASPSDYQNLSQMLKQLDKRRKQVFVEAMIVEASIDKLSALGTQWRATATKNGEPIIIGGVGQMDATSLQTIVTGLSGMTVGGMANFLNIPITTVAADGTVTNSTLNVPGFSALFRMNELRDAVNVLSTPQILTSDNKEAEIVVGQNVPFISQRERDITTTNTVLNSIERMDVGIKLRITPQITEGDYIKLDLYQEISSLTNQSDTVVINVGPTITKRSTKTSVVVKDNQTVVIGGLMSERDEENITKVPILGDIPFLGYLFKQRTVTKNKTNLLVFLTPHMVRESGSLARLTSEKQKELATAIKKYAPGELLVKFREGVTEEAALRIISEKGASVMRFMEQLHVYHIRLKKGQSVEDAVKEFTGVPDVLFAEPNYTIRIK